MPVRIKGENAYRDPNSGAVVFNDNEEYKRARARKIQAKKNKDQENRINNLERKMDRVENLLEEILDRINK